MTTSRTELRKVAGKGLALAGLLMMRGDAVLADANYCNPVGDNCPTEDHCHGEWSVYAACFTWCESGASTADCSS